MRRHHLALCGVSLVGLIAMAGPPPAHAERLEITLGSNTHRLTSASTDALSEGALTALSLSAARPLGFSLIPGVTMAAEASIDLGGTETDTFQTMTSLPTPTP
ncbi:MAG: hypothetical protein AAGC55_11760 [Myxococcota bacterium]